MRNADWSGDKSILLMEQYLRAPSAGKNHPEVHAMSALLRSAAMDPGEVGTSYRNAAGVARQFGNFGRKYPSAPPDRGIHLTPGGAVYAAIRRSWRYARSAVTVPADGIDRAVRISV
ncbi:hypothetical protein [Sphingopyxis sp.]|uniref:hypothetical protein n=1 Tax=Sphingopyxis sp. TaxID=1908224 RepID=UPI003BAA08DA